MFFWTGHLQGASVFGPAAFTWVNSRAVTRYDIRSASCTRSTRYHSHVFTQAPAGLYLYVGVRLCRCCMHFLSCSPVRLVFFFCIVRFRSTVSSMLFRRSSSFISVRLFLLCSSVGLLLLCGSVPFDCFFYAVPSVFFFCVGLVHWSTFLCCSVELYSSLFEERSIGYWFSFNGKRFIALVDLQFIEGINDVNNSMQGQRLQKIENRK